MWAPKRGQRTAIKDHTLKLCQTLGLHATGNTSLWKPCYSASILGPWTAMNNGSQHVGSKTGAKDCYKGSYSQTVSNPGSPCHRKHIAMETLLQRFHFGAVLRLHFGTTMNNGSQHVGSKTGAKACAIKDHNLNLCQTLGLNPKIASSRGP